jgi:predicted neutral ceramidase superfamily lipid hydrolase
MSGDAVSRRAVLGAAVGLPLAASGACQAVGPLHHASHGPPPRSGEEWDSAIAAFRSAEAEMRAVERATTGSSAEEEEVWLPLYEERLDAFGGAVRAVMVAAAPDFAAFAAKLELFFEHELEPNSADEEIVEAIRKDAQRLAGLA